MIKAGQRYRSEQSIFGRCLYSYSAPYTDGGTVTVPSGLAFEVVADVPVTASAAACRPVNYDEFETYFVPKAVREHEGYVGYTLNIGTSDISRKCTPA